MHLEILIQIYELLAMIPYFRLEYTTGKFAGKAFHDCAEQSKDLLEKELWSAVQQLTSKAECCIIVLWKFNLG